jgi:glucan 1,3-beta-glucosidase
MDNSIRGVNLGGWLIAERWMTPSLFKDFKGDDEYAFMQNLGASERIAKHRKSFITENDFEWLNRHNITLVRIPVGYWLFDAVDGFSPTVEYLDQAIKWAEKHSIKVLIDMHGAPGSQNGKDHSGKRGKALWFTDKNHQQQTIELLRRIAHRYKNSTALWGIELLNEPVSLPNYFMLLRFYRHSYSELRKIITPGTYTVFQDGFHALLFAGALWPRKGYPVVMDTHWYAFYPFGNSAARYRKLLRLYRGAILRYARLFHPIIVGEWSSVFPGRYFQQIPQQQHNMLLQQNIESQLQLYRNADGWIYWNYKHEFGGMWNFRSLVEQGIFPLSAK